MWWWPQGAGRRIILPGSSTSGARPRSGFRWWTKNTVAWRESTAGAERERLFRMMAGLFPSYNEYQDKTAREIPVVVLEPQGEVERL